MGKSRHGDSPGRGGIKAGAKVAKSGPKHSMDPNGRAKKAAKGGGSQRSESTVRGPHALHMILLRVGTSERTHRARGLLPL